MLSEVQKEEILQREKYIKEHFLDETVKELALHTGYSVSGCHKAIKRLGLSASNDVNYYRSFNDHPEEDANWFYFVGLMLADGSINERGWQINLVDKQVLEDISVWLSMKNGVKEYKRGSGKSNNPRYNLSARSKHFVDRLKYYGLSQNKTGMEMYKNIPDSYYKDFIRGFIDGDGCVSKGNITLYANKLLAERIMADLKRIYDIETKTYQFKNTENIWAVWMHVEYSRRLSKIIYDNCSLSLNRKRVIIDGHKSSNC